MPLQATIMPDSNTFDVIIIGGGPAGLTTAIYLAKAGNKVGYIERNIPGGKIVNLPLITNYPGYKSIPGAQLALNMYEQAEEAGATLIYGEVVTIDQYNEYHVVYTSDHAVKYCHSLVIATGMNNTKLPIENINKYEHKFISYCAICDGVLTKNKIVLVVGGNNNAINNAIYLSKICEKVYIINQFNEIENNEEIKKFTNVEIINNAKIVKFDEENNILKNVTIENINTHETEIIDASYIFVYIGNETSVNFLPEKYRQILNENKKIIVNDKMETTIPGLYAIGDVTNNNFNQISICVGDGAKAALNISKYLNKFKK